MEYVLPCRLLASTNNELTLHIEGNTFVIPLPVSTATPPPSTDALWLIVKDSPPEADLLNELLSS